MRLWFLIMYHVVPRAILLLEESMSLQTGRGGWVGIDGATHDPYTPIGWTISFQVLVSLA